ncbi:uncharacterized protein [Diadema antillarum]|uniref:uncharacterized protein n=1 Tax=Diadema antillarum TaxID=105358 RepID=UPI003A882996
MVKVPHPDYISIEKPFKISEFSWEKNELSKMMANFLDGSQEFVQRLQQLRDAEEDMTTKDSTDDDNLYPHACLTNAIKEKQVKFDEANLLEIPVSLLSTPPKQRLVRTKNDAHVQELICSFKRLDGNIPVPTIVAHIPNTLPKYISASDVLKGIHTLEVLGGNHTFEALQFLQYTKNVPVAVYAGLTNDEALHLAYEHNSVHQHSRSMTFIEEVCLFRKKLVGDPDAGLNQSARTKWRQIMATILGANVKQVRNKYRHHTWLASQPTHIWSLIVGVMNAWEKNTLMGQRTGPLKALHLAFLEKMEQTEAEDTLKKLLNGEMSFEEIK